MTGRVYVLRSVRSALSTTQFIGTLLFGIQLLGLKAEAAKDSRCKDVLISAHNHVAVTTCPLNDSQRAIRIRLNGTSKAVTAIFDARPRTRVDLFWEKFWFSEGDSFLSKGEQDHIAVALSEIENLSHESQEARQAESLLKFLSRFLEPNTRIEPFDRNVAAERIRPVWKLSWTSICEFIGQDLLAHFTLGHETYEFFARVGDRADGCVGRCGIECQQWGQWSDNQYTQECLDHDVCTGRTGMKLGECSDEFWAAAASYTLAPNCPSSP